MVRQTKEQTDRISDIVRTWHNEFPKWSKIYSEIEKGYNWLGGIQYTESEKKWYETQRRPVDVFNLILPHVNTLLGDFLENDVREKVYPRSGGSARIAAKLEDILEGIAIDNDELSVLTDTLIASVVKMGFIYQAYGNVRNPGGSIEVYNVDEMEMMFDSRSKDYFLDDAAYVMRHRWMLTDEIITTPGWRKHKSDLKQILIDRRDSAFWSNVSEEQSAAMNHKDFTMESRGQYRVIEFHEMRYELSEVAYNPMTRDAIIWDLDGQKADRFKKMNPEYRIIEDYAKVKYITSIIPGLNYELSHRKADLQDGQFDYIPMSCYHYGMTTVDNFGIFRNAFGPQHEINEWHNRSQDIMNKTANPGSMLRPDLLENPNEVVNYQGMTGLAIKVRPEAQSLDQAWRRIEPPSLPAGTEMMRQGASEMLPKILGVTPNQMGLSETSNEPAELFARRVKQATKAMKVIYYNIARTKKRRADKRLSLIQRYYTTEQAIMVMVPDMEEPKEVIINANIAGQIVDDVTVGRYQVFMADSENNPTLRMARFELKTKLVQMLVNIYGPSVIDPEWWFKESDLGDVQDMVNAIRATIGAINESSAESEAFTRADQLMTMANQRSVSGAPSPRGNSGMQPAQNNNKASTRQ